MPERADFKPERADFKPDRADFRPERVDFSPDRADISPEMGRGFQPPSSPQPPLKHTQKVSNTLVFPVLRLDHYTPTDQQIDKAFYRVLCPQLKRGRRRGNKLKKRNKKTSPTPLSRVCQD